MRKSILRYGLVLSAAMTFSAPASAAIIVSTIPEFNGNGTIANTFIGTFSYVIPVGDVIAAVNFSSTFGNTQVSSSAEGFVTVEGITVGTCPSSGPCANSPLAINFNFASSDFGLFADGSADLFYNQTGCCVIRLAESTLTITTRTVDGAIPEPGTWAMMLLGFGAVGATMRRARRAQAVPATA